jgi:hypothetical protein
MYEEDELFNFLLGLWCSAQAELRLQKVTNLSSAIGVANRHGFVAPPSNPKQRISGKKVKKIDGRGFKHKGKDKQLDVSGKESTLCKRILEKREIKCFSG